MSITKFKTGAIRDSQEGKEDYIETISWSAFKRYAVYMTGKKKKYGAGNFKKGIDIDSYERSLLRHVQKYMENKYEEGDAEREEDHLAAMVFNIFGIMHEEEMARKRNHYGEETHRTPPTPDREFSVRPDTVRYTEKAPEGADEGA